MQKKTPQIIRFDIVLMRDVCTLDHTIVHQRVNHTIGMPNIFTKQNIFSFLNSITSATNSPN